MKGLTMSQVAKASGVNIETVRYYERRGLIAEPPRNASGYRMYSSDVVEDIRFIKSAQDLGFLLEEMKPLLSLNKGIDDYPIEDMYRFAKAKIQEVEEKISQLVRFKMLLLEVTKHPESSLPLPKNQCPVIKRIIDGRGER
ncbi:MerR family transcriptional regulator [Paenibacillus harenae]|uniref:MerR family transcriptional regulator n=1 Tax=Paenibacillus harenae TaxID=306543 RepID=UPI0004260C62|nr:MerR family transcriptional regulator [Paenibacillus harenae]